MGFVNTILTVAVLSQLVIIVVSNTYKYMAPIVDSPIVRINSPAVRMVFFYKDKPPDLPTTLDLTSKFFTTEIQISLYTANVEPEEYARSEWAFWYGDTTPYCMTAYHYREWIWEKLRYDHCAEMMQTMRCILVSVEEETHSELLVTDIVTLHCKGYKDLTHDEWTYPLVVGRDMLGQVLLVKTSTSFYRVSSWVFDYTINVNAKGAIRNWNYDEHHERKYPTHLFTLQSADTIEALKVSNPVSELQVGAGVLDPAENKITLPSTVDAIQKYFRDRSSSVIYEKKAMPKKAMPILQMPFTPLKFNLTTSQLNNIQGRPVLIEIHSMFNTWYTCEVEVSCRPFYGITTFDHLMEKYDDQYKVLGYTLFELLESITSWCFTHIVKPPLDFLFGPNWSGFILKHLIIMSITTYFTSGNLYLSALIEFAIIVYFI